MSPFHMKTRVCLREPVNDCGYPELVRLSKQCKEAFLKNPVKQIRPLIQSKPLTSVLWITTGNVSTRKEFQDNLLNLSSLRERKAL